MRRREALMTELEPLRMESAEGHPWQEWASEEAQAADRLPASEPLDRQEGPVVDSAAPGAGGRGRLRPHAGRPLPHTAQFPPLAPGPRARAVHVRRNWRSRSAMTSRRFSRLNTNWLPTARQLRGVVVQLGIALESGQYGFGSPCTAWPMDFFRSALTGPMTACRRDRTPRRTAAS